MGRQSFKGIFNTKSPKIGWFSNFVARGKFFSEFYLLRFAIIELTDTIRNNIYFLEKDNSGYNACELVELHLKQTHVYISTNYTHNQNISKIAQHCDINLPFLETETA